MPTIGNANFLWIYPGARAGDFKFTGVTQPPQNNNPWENYFTNNVEASQTCSVWVINTASAVPAIESWNAVNIRQHGVCFISSSAGDVQDDLFSTQIRQILQSNVTASFGDTGSVFQPFPLEDDWSDGAGGGALIIVTGSDAGPYKDGAPSGSLLRIIHTSDYVSGSGEGLQVYNTMAEQYAFLRRTFPEIDAAVSGPRSYASFSSGENAIASCMLVIGGIFLTASVNQTTDRWNIPTGMKGDLTRGNQNGIYTLYGNGTIKI